MDTDVTVREIMDRTFVGVSESDDLRETVELMVEDSAESVVVLRGQEPVGLLTRRDVLERIVSGGIDSATVADAMTATVPTVEPDVTLPSAAAELSTRDTQRLVVTDGTEPLGVLTEHDIVSAPPFGREGIGNAGEGGPESTPMAAEREGGDAGTPEDFEDQSICEGCGSFVRDLTPVNGRLLCADCRDI